MRFDQKKFDRSINEFCHDHKEVLVIIADPKSDKILVAYEDYRVYGRLRSVTGKRIRVARDILRKSTFHKPGVRDSFIGGLVDTLKLPLMSEGGQAFYRWVTYGAKSIADKIAFEKNEKGRILKSKS